MGNDQVEYENEKVPLVEIMAVKIRVGGNELEMTLEEVKALKVLIDDEILPEPEHPWSNPFTSPQPQTVPSYWPNTYTTNGTESYSITSTQAVADAQASVNDTIRRLTENL